MMRSGRPIQHMLERDVAGSDRLGLDVAAALERVLDEPGDILLVFDDEHSRFLHDSFDPTGSRFHGRVAEVKSELHDRSRLDDAVLWARR